ncbi:MAG: N-acetylglucosamine-6-phosphate deacetylase [Bacilli bacterium]
MKGFKNSYIYVEGEGIVKTSITIDNGRIISIGDNESDDAIQLDDNHILVPGFIDQHIHGCHGHDVMEASKEALQEMANELLQEGVTFFCPTTMSMSIEDIKAALRNVTKVKQSQNKGAEIIGIHLEGPFLNRKYHGAQAMTNIIEGDEEVLSNFIKISGNEIRMMTFAYEQNGKVMLPMMQEHDITPSLGHSDATAKQALEAFEDGVHCVTHCYNAMRGIHHRDIGVVGAAFLKEEVMCELIADLKHVSEEAIRLLFKVKGPDKIILVSDSMEAKYLPEGEYSLGGQKVIVKDGAARLEDGTLAGSVLRLDQALKNIHKIIPELSLTQLIDLVTKNPAKNLQINDIGSIALNKKARFTVIDRDLNVICTY